MKTTTSALFLAFLATGCSKPREEAPRETQPELRSGTVTPNTPNLPKTEKPVEPKDPLKEADADMRKVLVELNGLGGKPLATLSPEEARKQPTPADAVKSLLTKEKKKTTPTEVAKVDDRKFPGADGKDLAMRIYTPKTSDKAPLPVVVYWHGGGFAIADIDTYDASARAIAKGADAIVVSADYRRAPEHKFPAAHDDAIAAYDWVLKNAASFGGDAQRVAVAGESAGGNLAANVSIAARDKGMPMPKHQLLVYPLAQTNMETKSYQEWANAKPLDKANMGWFVQQYLKPTEKADPRISLVDAKLQGLPETTIVLAEIDPLRTDGEMFAERLEKADVKVEKKTYQGVTHEFFGMGSAVDDAKDAEDYAAGRLKSALKK